jgi:hypothetical protein
MRRYGAAHARQLPFDTFAPRTGRGEALARVESLPAVKNQGSLPVCSAVVALSMYQQLLLLHGYSPNGSRSAAPELGWAWIYLRARASAQGVPVNAQLLSGVPLDEALRALVLHGVLTEAGFFLYDPAALQEQLEQLSYTPRGRLLCPLRVLSVLPTEEALAAALRGQAAVGFAFAIDTLVDAWMHDAAAQQDTAFELPAPAQGSPRLATHAALITALDATARRVTVQNSFGPDFGLMGFFFVPLSLLLRADFSGLQFYILTRAG